MFDTLIKAQARDETAKEGPRHLTKKMVSMPEKDRFPKVPNKWNLSGQEFAVIKMTAAGFTQIYIAKQLCLSPKTVNTYMVRAREKMEAMTPVHAAILFEREYRDNQVFDPFKAKYDKAQRCMDFILGATVPNPSEKLYTLSVGQLIEWHNLYAKNDGKQ